jgi:hypothetical protein
LFILLHFINASFITECSVKKMNFWTKYSLKMCLPFALAFLSFAWNVLNVKIKHQEFQIQRVSIVSQVSILISSLYTLLVAGAVSPFVCAEQFGSHVLLSSPSIKCFKGEWNTAAFFIYTFAIVYFVGYPVFVGITFWNNRRNLKDDDFAKKFEHLIGSYKQECFYWELVMLGKRMSFAIVSQVAPIYGENNVFPYFLVIFLLFCFIVLEYIFMPFKKHSTSVKSFLWTCLAMILLLCDGFVFKNAYVPETQRAQFAALMVTLIAISVGATLLAMTLDVLRRRKQTEASNFTSLPIATIGGVQTQGVRGL